MNNHQVDSESCVEPGLPVVPKADCAVMELRILTGCHQGASLVLASGELLRIGSGDDCDVLLLDCGLALGASVQVGWQENHWSVLTATDAGEADATPVRHALGAAASLGEVSATICGVDRPWPVFTPPPAAAPARDLALPDLAEPDGVHDAGEASACEDGPPPARKSRTAAAPGRQRTQQLAGVGALCLAALASGWAMWHYVPASANVHHPATETPAAPLFSPQMQDQAVKEATLAIALVDPALRLQVTPHLGGGVTVSGWVDTVEQFDRVAQGLSGLRPLPRLAVRTGAEVIDTLSEAGAVHGVNLQLSLAGAGKLQVKGVVSTPAVQQEVLAQLRARAPQGITLVDGLRVASLQGPAVMRWLSAQGLSANEAKWDGEQLVLHVDVNEVQRQQLERLLAAKQTPLTDVPFMLQLRMLQAVAPGQRLDARQAGLPFRIRSVVGGAAPYVVLDDGAKLQPGATRAGWRLASISPDHLVFDGPKRLEVSR